MEKYERISSIKPAGVMATACKQKEPAATREAPAVVVVVTNRQLARVRPGPMGWRRGSYYRRGRITPAEGRGLSVCPEKADVFNGR